MIVKSTNIEPLDLLIKKEGIKENIRDYYSAINNRLKILYSKEDFYIAEDETYQPWLSVMGNIPKDIEGKKLRDMLEPLVKNEKYIAVYTNNEKISKFFQEFDILTYHEDFFIACIKKIPYTDEKNIRLASESDLPYIEKTYKRSGHKQLLNRILQKQMWIMEENNHIQGYAGIHKDYSLGFEYVDPDSRRKGIAGKLQFFISNYMIKNNITPYVMVSVKNDIAKNFQIKSGSEFADKIFYFYAKGPYELE